MADDDTVVVVAEAAPPQPAVEASADAAVEIARIEADAAVDMNAANNDAAVAIADTVAADDEDVAWLKSELAGLLARCETNAADLSALQVQMVAMAGQLDLMRSDLTAMALITPPPTQQNSSPEAEAEALARAEAEAMAQAENPAASPDGPRDESAGDAAAAEAARRATRQRRYL